MENNHNFILTIAYDGTRFCGWQQQPNQRSVLGVMESAFAHAFKTDALMLGASRTDAGVHALGQVMRCITPLTITPEKLMWVWNNSLPSDIHIRSVAYAKPTFHPWYNVAHKTYYYHIFTQRPLPFLAPYGWYVYQQLDVAKLNQALQLFVGTHDFRSFCSDDAHKNTIRTIDAISLTYIKRFNVYRVTVTGEKFLRHMIRRIVGAAVAVATRSSLSVHSIKEILAAHNPRQELPNAPGNGLLLRSITYKKDIL